MRRQLHIPVQVQRDIATKLTEGVNKTLQDWHSAAEDEDVVTGHLGARLTTHARKVLVLEDQRPGVWTWSLGYRKFRGRGQGAPESLLGADGIFELTIENPNEVDTKSLLFQSKMKDAGGRALAEQCAKLSTWREAAFVMSYAENEIGAISIDHALARRGSIATIPTIPLAEYLSTLFIPCEIGDNDLRYFAQERTLMWRNSNDEVVSTQFSIRHRFKLKVEPPSAYAQELQRAKKIPVSDIHKNRMDAKPEEILSSSVVSKNSSARTAQRVLSKIYHPDVWNTFSTGTRELMKVRMQEINRAGEELKRKK